MTSCVLTEIVKGKESIIGHFISSNSIHIGERISWFKCSAWRVKDIAHRLNNNESEVLCTYLICEREK